MSLFSGLRQYAKDYTVRISIVTTLIVALSNLLVSIVIFYMLQGKYISERQKKIQILAINLLRTSVDYNLAKQEFRLPSLYNSYRDHDREIKYIIFNKYTTEDQVTYTISKEQLASSSTDVTNFKDSQFKSLKALKEYADKKVPGLEYDWKGIREISIGSDYYEVVQAITVEDAIVGFLRIGISDKFFKSEVRTNIILAVALSFLGFLVIIIMNYVIIRAFNSLIVSLKTAQAELQDYAENLQKKVRARTKQLEDIVTEISALKNQQDGDYFLTTQLIKPLAVNQVNSENVNVDFLVKQKKNFTFRRWDEEIGGDICISHSITLADKKEYALVLNADAMGKSIQGAGGALVMGAVFEALVVRTRNRPEMNSIGPETWLQTSLSELQQIFITFNGNMMMSLVMGLLDEQTGMFYYVNAEHPWPVLYREAKASFLEANFTCRKLGMPVEDGEFQVMQFQLEAGDVVLLGSDGKDDLIFEDPISGEKIINEDETKFLEYVELCAGYPDRIVAMIQAETEIKDDISILRMAYKMQEVPEPDAIAEDLGSRRKSALAEISGLMLDDALTLVRHNIMNRKIQEAEIQLQELGEQHSDDNPDILRAAIQYNTLTRNNENILKLSRRYLEIKPEQIKYLYMISLSLYKLGWHKEAMEAAEELFKKDPDMLANALHLSRLYVILEEYDKARSCLAQCDRIDANNPQAARIRMALEKKLEPKT